MNLWQPSLASLDTSLAVSVSVVNTFRDQPCKAIAIVALQAEDVLKV